MQSFPYNLKIEAASEVEAEAKMNAITVVMKKLNTRELTKLAHVLQHDKALTLLAKAKLGL